MIQRTKPESATSNAKLADKSQPQHTPGNDLSHGDRQFLTNSQLQEILPLSRRSIFEWRRKGILPSIQVGSKILYHR
jgi:Helix-turn-helix domain